MRTLQLDWETEQKRSVSYFNQIMELEKERDQVSVSEGHESKAKITDIHEDGQLLSACFTCDTKISPR